MENQKKMMVVLGLVAAVLFQSVAAQQTAHVVGGSTGWTVPNNGASEYATWASGQKFVVGDTLTFNFATNTHDVVQVPKASFDSCSSANAIGSTVTTGPANITLASAGDHYYICTFGRHCASGQKLAITATASTTSPDASPTAPSPMFPPPPPTTSTTPSPTSDLPCPPVQSPSGEPTVRNTPGPASLPPSSSSSTVAAGFLLCLIPLVMGFFF